MSDLVTFLRARITEDEDIARKVEGKSRYTWPLWTTTAAHAYGRELGPRGSVEASPARVLAECAAKRVIIKRYERACYQADHDDEDFRDIWEEIASTLEQVLMAHAQVFADHPDYRPAWAPDDTS
jgi:hypothetical protein